jgi:acetyl esterase/lipase
MKHSRHILLTLLALLTIVSSATAQRRRKVTPYLVPDENAPAIIVCPGGSYSWLDRETEGRMVCEWLQSQGIAAFLLEYRVQGIPSFVTHYRYVFRGRRHPDPLCDLQATLLYVRRHARACGIDPHRIGAMGFSAGGHLVASAAEFFDTDFGGIVPGEVGDSLRPDFVVPVYPVVTLSDERYVHARSRRALLGEWGKHRQRMRDSLSLEQHVRPDMPPVFLVNCEDDPIVKYPNSILLDSALTAEGVPHQYIRYRTGGHGFGANPEKGTEECREWRTTFLDWMRALGFLPEE